MIASWSSRYEVRAFMRDLRMARIAAFSVSPDTLYLSTLSGF